MTTSFYQRLVHHTSVPKPKTDKLESVVFEYNHPIYVGFSATYLPQTKYGAQNHLLASTKYVSHNITSAFKTPDLEYLVIIPNISSELVFKNWKYPNAYWLRVQPVPNHTVATAVHNTYLRERGIAE